MRIAALFLLLSTISIVQAANIKGSGTLEPGLQGRDDIIFFTDFESPTWRNDWGHKDDGRSDTVDQDPKNKFEALSGKALRVEVTQGKHYGTSFGFNFKQQIGAEPEEIYFRYYIRFSDNWAPEGSGKLPGIAGTYGRAGWGGRRANGTNGWSARGLFMGMQNSKTPTGFYAYHAEMGRWGAHWKWENQQRGYLLNNRWYCLEQYVKLNNPGTKDGIMRGWVDGQLAFEKTDVRMRDIDSLKIEKVWIDVYYGGSWTPKYDMFIYMDNMVIARKPIGPMQKKKKVAKKDKKQKKKVEKTTPTYTATPAGLDHYTSELKQLVHIKKSRPRFELDMLKSEIEIVDVNDKQTTVLIPKTGSTMSLDIWSTMSLNDRKRLAVVMAKRNQPKQQAIAAFFLLAAGETGAGKARLRQSGDHAQEVMNALVHK